MKYCGDEDVENGGVAHLVNGLEKVCILHHDGVQNILSFG